MKRITFIWAEDMTEAQTEELSERVDMAMSNPDKPIVSNFAIQFNQVEIPEEGDAQEVSHRCCGGAGHAKANTKKIVAICAPNMKPEDLPALQKLIEEAIAGPKRYLVTNQAIEVCEFDAPGGEAKPE